MILQSFHIRNFRRLRDVHITLEPDRTIFVGANNSGKTSAAHALSLFLREEKFLMYDFSAEAWNKFDDVANHFLFSYDKLLGITPPSDTDRKNQAEGKETVVDRTRRLFYICCSRALKGLAVVCYTSHPDVLKGRVLESGLFPTDCIFGAADLQP
jgi:hypothetical protein